MKKSLLLFAIAALTALTGYADQLSGSGYYRVKNYKTGRYIFVLDNKAYQDAGATTYDLAAVQLRSGFNNCESDPASVLYIQDKGSNQIDILAQGTGIYKLSELYLKTRWDSGKKAYLVYGTKSNITKYLGDPESLTDEELEEFFPGEYVYLTAEGNGDFRYWVPEKISLDAGRYFGVKATVCANGEYWAPLYTSFPYSSAANGMTAYYVTKVDAQKAVAVIAPMPEGKVDEGTGVIIKCVSATPSQNKVNVGDAPTTALSNNRLRGVYFNNTTPRHVNQRPYDSATMRVLGVTKSGRVGYVVSKDKYLARNQSYLIVPNGCPDELELVTLEEYEGVDDVLSDNEVKPFDIYNLQGIRVATGATSFEGLPAGIYVSNGHKVIVR